MIYHIPCTNDATAKKTENDLKSQGFTAYAAFGFHPMAQSFVVVQLHPDQNPQPLLDLGGYALNPAPIHPVPESDHQDHPHEEVPAILLASSLGTAFEDEEEETEPDPEETDGEG